MELEDVEIITEVKDVPEEALEELSNNKGGDDKDE